MSWESHTISDDYLSLSFEGMKEAKRKIISSIEAKKAQRDNISRAIESLQVPDSVLRGYGNDLILIKNSISKDIDELARVSAHIDYVMRRFEEVDNEYAARFKSAGYGIEEKLGLQRENGIFGGCIAGLTSIVSQVTNPFSGRYNESLKKAMQQVHSSLDNKNAGKLLLVSDNRNITAQADRMYKKNKKITLYNINTGAKIEVDADNTAAINYLLNHGGYSYNRPPVTLYNIYTGAKINIDADDTAAIDYLLNHGGYSYNVTEGTENDKKNNLVTLPDEIASMDCSKYSTDTLCLLKICTDKYLNADTESERQDALDKIRQIKNFADSPIGRVDENLEKFKDTLASWLIIDTHELFGDYDYLNGTQGAWLGIYKKTSITVNENKPIEVTLDGKKMNIRVDVEVDSNKIQIQSGHGKESPVDIRIDPNESLEKQIPKNLKKRLSSGQYDDLLKYLKKAVNILKNLK